MIELLTFETLKSAQGGDKIAFEDIYRASAPYVHSVARRMGLRDDEAADVVQETMAKVYAKMPAFMFRSSFKTWIFRIARNAALDHVRRRRLPACSLEEVPEMPASDHDAVRIAQQLAAFLKVLPERDRRLLVMKDIEGYSFEDLAREEHIPVNTAKTIVVRARQRLVKTARGETPSYLGVAISSGAAASIVAVCAGLLLWGGRFQTPSMDILFAQYAAADAQDDTADDQLITAYMSDNGL